MGTVAVPHAIKLNFLPKFRLKQSLSVSVCSYLLEETDGPCVLGRCVLEEAPTSPFTIARIFSYKRAAICIFVTGEGKHSYLPQVKESPVTNPYWFGEHVSCAGKLLIWQHNKVCS